MESDPDVSKFPQFPDFVVNSFVTNKLKSFTSFGKFQTLRISLNDKKKTAVNKLPFCCSTSLTVVRRNGCLVDIQEIIVKSFPENRLLLEVIEGKKCFENELYFYKEILGELNDFQADYKLTGDIQAPILKSDSLEEGEEALIFLQADHWVPLYEKPEENLSEKDIRIIIDELCRLHGVSYAYIKLNPEKIQIWNDRLSDNVLYGFKNDAALEIFKKKILAIEEKLKLQNNFAFSRQLIHLSETINEQLNRAMKLSSFQCLVHGDMSSNFLMGYKNKEPIKAKLTNWNLVKFGSPVLDLSLLLFTNLSEYDSMDRYLNYYYNNLLDVLKPFGLSLPVEYNMKQFTDEWKNNGIFGMILSSLILSVDWDMIDQKIKSSETNIEDFLSLCGTSPIEKNLTQISKIVEYCTKNKLL